MAQLTTTFSAFFPRFGTGLGHKVLTLALNIQSERKALAGLDARLLADIGVSAQDAGIEAQRPMWDLGGRKA